MNGEFIVGVTIVLVLWVFVILIAITPWCGMSILPYMVMFTFLGAAFLLFIVWSYKSEAFDDLSWETILLFALVIAAFLVGIFVLWYFVRRKLNSFAKHVDNAHSHASPSESRSHVVREIMGDEAYEESMGIERDEETNIPYTPSPSRKYAPPSSVKYEIPREILSEGGSGRGEKQYSNLWEELND